jgi:uncharacterized membrane protein
MPRQDRLDQPRTPRGLRRPRINTEAFGAYSERIARYFGTARYLVIQTIFVVAWIAVNALWGIQYSHAKSGCTTTEHIVGNQIVQEQSPSCTSGTKPFDPYPFILLNLAFSTQAAYAAPLILLAQNRQADRDRIQAEADRARDDRAIADTEYLAREIASIRMALGDVVTRDFLRSELGRMESARDSVREPGPADI